CCRRVRKNTALISDDHRVGRLHRVPVIASTTPQQYVAVDVNSRRVRSRPLKICGYGRTGDALHTAGECHVLDGTVIWILVSTTIDWSLQCVEIIEATCFS